MGTLSAPSQAWILLSGLSLSWLPHLWQVHSKMAMCYAMDLWPVFWCQGDGGGERGLA